MTSSVDVSIVVPCRNEAAEIERCIRSILAQDAGEATMELIVADGMSDDGTREIVHDLASRDNRIRIVDNPGRIVSTGLNAAIQAAAGSVIVRMDAANQSPTDFYLLPRIDVRQSLLRLGEYNGAAIDTYRYDTLNYFVAMAARATIEVAP